MAKVVITYEYKPNLDHYPAGTDTAADALRWDVEQARQERSPGMNFSTAAAS